MAGDDRARHCTLCDRSVFDFARMTREEIGRALTEADGRVCARLTRRSDGTLRTREDSHGAPARASRSRKAAGAMLLSALALASGCATRPHARAAGPRLSLRLENEPAARVQAQDATFQGIALVDYAALPGLTITLRDEATGAEQWTITDGNGAFSISGLRPGLYRAEVKLDNFQPGSVDHVVLRAGEVTRARAIVRLETGETVTVGAIGTDPLSLNDAIISTTFPQDLINKLPI